MTDFDDILGAEPEVDTRSEKAIQSDILVRLTALPGSLLFRNNTGQAWQGTRLRVRHGRTIRLEQGMVLLANARPVKFGLEGSADIIGAVQGAPLAVEVKTVGGRQQRTQEFFERAWVDAGGIYILARSADDAERQVRRAIGSPEPGLRKVERHSRKN